MGMIKQGDGWRLPDEVWQQMEPLLPARKVHPLGCHNPRVSDRSAMNAKRQVGRVLADPVVHEAGRLPGGFAGLVYVRLHGSPHMYASAYDRAVLDALVARLRLAATLDAAVWCIFDNTAEGAAIEDALYTVQGLARR